VLTASLTMPGAQYPTPASRAQFIARALDGARALPGVESAGAIFGLPMTNFGFVISVRSVDGADLPQTPGEFVSVSVRAVSPDYFRAMGIRFTGGRDFRDGDALQTTRVSIVNESAARLLWPDMDAVGHTLVLGTRLGQDEVRTGGAVVGVVDDTREAGLDRPPRPTVFVPYAQEPTTFVALVVRGVGGTPDAASLRRVLEAIDPTVPMFRVRTTAQLGSALVAQPRLLLVLMTLFAAVAVFIAALGLYGLLADSVAARVREIGVRRAVGATTSDIVGLVAGRTVWTVALGAATGVALSLVLSNALGRFVFGGDGRDVVAYAVTLGVVAVAAGVATVVPCRRALRVDPAEALRTD
jgi:putative ABC transport system permease protein